MKPRCFDSEQQYQNWFRLFAMTGSEKVNYCQDCTPNYAMSMRLAGRCEHPEFDINDPRLKMDNPQWENRMPAKLGRPCKVKVVLADI